MELQRTANAGVLLKLDGISILLDGLSEQVEGYLPTPSGIAQQLLDSPPDILAFTHMHADHCSESLLLPYRKQNLRPILGPESLYLDAVRVKDVTIIPVESRHLGKVEPGLLHTSYIICGSRCVWFLGDAAPVQWRNRVDLPRPDLMIVPYAYGNTKVGWELACGLTKQMVLLHLPERKQDPYGLWQSVEQVSGQNTDMKLWIPEMGEQIHIL